MKHLLLWFLLAGLPTSLSGQLDAIFKTQMPWRILTIDSVYKSFGGFEYTPPSIDFIKSLKKKAIEYGDEPTELLADAYLCNIAIHQHPEHLHQELNKQFRILQVCRLQGYKELELKVLNWRANALDASGHTGSSIVYFIEAERLWHEVDSNFWTQTHDGIVYAVAFRLYTIGEYERAKDIILHSELFHLKGHGAMLSWDLLSQIYLKQGDFDSSAFYIQLGLQKYMEADTASWWFKGWRGIFEGSYGKISYAQNNFVKALNHFRFAMQNTGEALMYNNVATFGLLTADCYIRLDQPQKARTLIPEIRNAVYRQVNPKIFLDYHKLLLMLDLPSSNPDQTASTLDSIQYWTTRINLQNDQDAFAREELKSELAIFSQKENQFKQNIERQLLLRNILWGFLLLAILTSAVLLFRKQRLITLKDREIIKARAELEAFRQTMIEKVRLTEMGEINQVKETTDSELDELKENTILTKEEWTHFKKLFDNAYVGFFSRLDQKFPGLTSGEIRLIALMRLSLTTREMASTLGVGTGAIRTMKSRLLKKLHLPEDSVLEEVIAAI